MKINKSLALISLALVFSNLAVPCVQAMKTSMKRSASESDVKEKLCERELSYQEKLTKRMQIYNSLGKKQKMILDSLSPNMRNVTLDCMAFHPLAIDKN
jgi:hypothetical protein